MENSNQQELLAFNYVMQLLPADETRAVTTRIKEDAEFAQLVSEWEQRITGLDLTVTPKTPPASVWKNIQKNIQQEQQKNIIPKKGLVSIWGWSTAVTGFIAVALITFTLFFQSPHQINMDNQWMVTAEMESWNITLAALNPEPMPKNKVCNLWIRSESTTMKVGTLPMHGSKVINLKNMPNVYRMFGKKATLLISVDDIGSDTKVPTNPTVQGAWL